jgi:hypothetical protein
MDVTGIAAQAPGFSHAVSGAVESIDSLRRS